MVDTLVLKTNLILRCGFKSYHRLPINNKTNKNYITNKTDNTVSIYTKSIYRRCGEMVYTLV